jgi:serine/threonine protein phosphatase 1
MLRPAPGDPFTDIPVAPFSPFRAVGDVHGRDDLLAPLLGQLLEEDKPVVLVGDYIDRGADSAAVLERLYLARDDTRLICLRGNHEEMMLKFLKRPRRIGRIWLSYGGLATLESFGITGYSPLASPEELVSASRDLADALGEKQTWLSKLPYWWQSGNVSVMHAGADPRTPLEQQLRKTFAWGHPASGSAARSDGQWVIHGHRQVKKVNVADGRIAIDTGAYKTGRLTAVEIGQGTIALV